MESERRTESTVHNRGKRRGKGCARQSANQRPAWCRPDGHWVSRLPPRPPARRPVTSTDPTSLRRSVPAGGVMPDIRDPCAGAVRLSRTRPTAYSCQDARHAQPRRAYSLPAHRPVTSTDPTSVQRSVPAGGVMPGIRDPCAGAVRLSRTRPTAYPCQDARHAQPRRAQ